MTFHGAIDGYFASKIWNSLPNNVRSEPTLTRRLLKSNLLSDIVVFVKCSCLYIT